MHFSFAAVDIVVYFQDKTGLHLSVADGQRCEAGELFEMVMEEMKLPTEAREVFSLWLVSDLLGKLPTSNSVCIKHFILWTHL